METLRNNITRSFYDSLIAASMAGEILPHQEYLQVLTSREVEILPLLDAAYQVRKKYHQNNVEIHIINNIQNGLCPEDCHYCAQATSSKAPIEDYPIKSDEEILAEAKHAAESGAFRYCMVSSGRGPSQRRVERLASLVQKIKSQYSIEVCISAGLMDENAAKKLKEAGLDRLNHNLNTSERNYPNICTTHTFQDRVNTLSAARNVGLEICSGMIAGMGETPDDIINIALRLKKFNARSIPINFLIPIDGNVLTKVKNLSPEYCLRILCLFRFLNPTSEIRVAAGREGHLRSLEVMALYPANSLFLDGYLNTKGERTAKTLRMIKDAGFDIKSEHSLDELLSQHEEDKNLFSVDGNKEIMKQFQDLRPQFSEKPKSCT